MAFTSHADAAFDVCFENQLVATHAVMNPSRHIELDIDIGADARDWSAIQAQEKLKPVETELRRVQELISEIVGEMEYLRVREQKLRDTNESTNERVKWFAYGTMGMLVGLGVWQVIYLRAYFRYRLFMIETMMRRTDVSIAGPAIIIDNGHPQNLIIARYHLESTNPRIHAGQIKGGYAGEDAPRRIF
ncbi:MAG: hypothetical protein Q9164_006335, partial [Protoblastenia rupestris]